MAHDSEPGSKIERACSDLDSIAGAAEMRCTKHLLRFKRCQDSALRFRIEPRPRNSSVPSYRPTQVSACAAS